MQLYLDQTIDASTYQARYFSLMKRRMVLSDEESQILQQAYGDADDCDSKINLPYTIDEPELRRRVAASIEKFSRLQR